MYLRKKKLEFAMSCSSGVGVGYSYPDVMCTHPYKGLRIVFHCY